MISVSCITEESFCVMTIKTKTNPNNILISFLSNFQNFKMKLTLLQIIADQLHTYTFKSSSPALTVVLYHKNSYSMKTYCDEDTLKVN